MRKNARKKTTQTLRNRYGICERVRNSQNANIIYEKRTAPENNRQGNRRRCKIWIWGFFYIPPQRQEHMIAHITEQTWRALEHANKNTTSDTDISQILETTRTNSKLRKITEREPYMQSWINTDYAGGEIKYSKTSKTTNRMAAKAYSATNLKRQETKSKTHM